MWTASNKLKHERSKDVRKGNSRLERHTGHAFRGDSKKNGAGGKGTWGDAVEDWEREMGTWVEGEEQEELIESVVEAKPVPKAVVKPERKRKMSPLKSEMAFGPIRARRTRTVDKRPRPYTRSSKPLVPSTNLTVSQADQQRISFGAGFEPAVSMGATYNGEPQPVTIRTFQDELQDIVHQLAGSESSLSSDMAQLRMKKMMSKQMMKRNYGDNPRAQTRNGVRVKQPGTRLGSSTRCH